VFYIFAKVAKSSVSQKPLNLLNYSHFTGLNQKHFFFVKAGSFLPEGNLIFH